MFVLTCLDKNYVVNKYYLFHPPLRWCLTTWFVSKFYFFERQRKRTWYSKYVHLKRCFVQKWAFSLNNFKMKEYFSFNNDLSYCFKMGRIKIKVSSIFLCSIQLPSIIYLLTCESSTYDNVNLFIKEKVWNTHNPKCYFLSLIPSINSKYTLLATSMAEKNGQWRMRLIINMRLYFLFQSSENILSSCPFLYYYNQWIILLQMPSPFILRVY